MNGVLVIDKAAGMTSHDVVHRVRRIVGERSVGHLGTLDPMATGVLPLVLGRLTRLAQFYTSSDKEYEGEIRFGFATTTYDAEGEQVGEARTEVATALSADQVRAAAERFQGEIEQVPPAFSAKKIQGVPAYKLARSNKEVELKAVPVTVHDFEIEGAIDGRARFRARVSSGTYVRCLAHELGQALGVGGHLASLRRTVSGEFRIDDAVTLEQLAAALECGALSGSRNEPSIEARLENLLVHPRRLLPGMPCVTATDDVVGLIRNGRAVNLPELSRAKQVKVFRGQRELIAIAARVAGTLFQPKVVFAE
jgi:tRNA pseudouridine55 synthase